MSKILERRRFSCCELPGGPFKEKPKIALPAKSSGYSTLLLCCVLQYHFPLSPISHTQSWAWNLNLIKAAKPSEFNLSVTEKAEIWGPWAKPYTPSDSGFARPAKPLIVSALASRATTTSKSNVIITYTHCFQDLLSFLSFSFSLFSLLFNYIAFLSHKLTISHLRSLRVWVLAFDWIWLLYKLCCKVVFEIYDLSIRCVSYIVWFKL